MNTIGEKIERAIEHPDRIAPYVWNEIILKKGYVTPAMTYFSRLPIGDHVFTKDWDILVILDTCRVDALREVAPEYDFLENIESVASIGSTSPEWIAQTFDREYSEELSRTGYISANAWAERVIKERQTPEEHSGVPAWSNWDVIEADELAYLGHAWEYEPDGTYGHPDGYVPSVYMTDQTISRYRGGTEDRLIVHYNQPHHPYTNQAFEENRKLKKHEKEPWTYLWGGGDRDLVWSSYLNELRSVLNDVETLLSNVDATVAISADHGEAFGEYGVYGHGAGLLHPYIKKVPWVKVNAENEEEYQPELEKYEEKMTRSVEENLRALAYIE